MKKLLALLLALSLCLPFFSGCASLPEGTVEETKTEENKTLTEEELTRFLEFYPTDPQKLSAEKLAALPIASSELSPAQLRQLALDYFELQLSFLWKTNLDVLDYPTTYASKMKKSLEQKYLYSGIPYQSQGTGNLYRWMEYYDPETGVMDLKRAFAENGGYGDGAAVTSVKTDENGNITYKRYRSFMTLFNQCSVASYWGWGRVINSANFGWTYDMTVYNGFIPVGCYTYPNMQKIDKFGEVTDLNPTAFDTKDVIAHVKSENGSQGMLACYAQAKPGDCLVSSGHAMMVKSVNIEKNKDGSINYARSSMTIMDQGESWNVDSFLSENPWRRQGGVESVHPLSYYEKAGYLPFTCREYLDPEDPADQKHIDFYNAYIKNNTAALAARYSAFDFSSTQLREMNGEGVEKSETFLNLTQLGDSISLSQLDGLAVAANYPISDLFLTVTDKDGKELKQNIYRALSPQIRQVKMTATETKWEMGEDGKYKTILDGIAPLATGENKIKITLQLSTGEKLVALEKTLTA